MACSTLDPAKTAHRESGSKSSCCAPTVPFCAKRLAATAKPAFAFCATCAEQGSAPSTNFALPDTGQTKATDIKRKRNHKRWTALKRYPLFKEQRAYRRTTSRDCGDPRPGWPCAGRGHGAQISDVAGYHSQGPGGSTQSRAYPPDSWWRAATSGRSARRPNSV